MTTVLSFLLTNGHGFQKDGFSVTLISWINLAAGLIPMWLVGG